LTLAGTFQSDVATVNNVRPYFDSDNFEPRYQWRMNLPDLNGLWNPRGSGAMRLTDVRVTSACLPSGRVAYTTAEDPAIGGRVADDDLRANAKFADLDPTNQLVPEIYGWRLRLLDAAGDIVLRADFRPAAMDDLWMRATLPSGRSDPAATYQSVLTNLEWASRLDSGVLRALRDSTQDGMLSIKLNLDGVEDGVEHWPDNLTYGRIVGAIGPYDAGEPHHFVAARRLRKASGTGRLNHAPCRVDEESRTVFVDLGNSIPASSRGGPLVDVGPLRLAILEGASGKPRVLASLAGTDPDSYPRTASIASATLDAEQLATVGDNRLAVVDAADEPAVLLAENADASLVRADGFVFRLYPQPPSDTDSATFFATRYGRPAAGVELFLGTGSLPPAVAMPAVVRTDAGGRAELRITGTDPGNPRKILDGVAVQVPYGFAQRPTEPEGRLSIRVFDLHRAPANPTWARDVQPIFRQYANLFPVMHSVFDLDNYHHVVRHKVYIRRTMLADRGSPNHMPVTRDLSPGKRDMIVKWLDTEPEPPVLDITSRADLRAALQQALLVEQATIPPYLAALFSLRPDYNVKVAEIIRGVVLEEMQHMAQVGNLLNAVGGEPQIGRPGLVPTYPGRLPGPVLPDLKVRLRAFSLEQVRDVFMAIEQPQHPTVDGKPFRGAVIDRSQVTLDRSGKVLAAGEEAMRTLEDWFHRAEYTPLTIGWFYNQIARAVSVLDKQGGLFTGDPGRQVSWPDAPATLYQVTDRRSALLAIYQIIEQGEGSPHDLNGNDIADPDELGHYYRFEEIAKGRTLVQDARGRWVYEGPEIPFDPVGVYPVVDDADTYRLPAGSAARRDSQQCDESYTNLLTSLNRVFNGHPSELDDAVGLMNQVQVQAKKLYDVPAPGDEHKVLGPAFQSPGVHF
jgi:hypothetical protein